jgi:hypothetical protein
MEGNLFDWCANVDFNITLNMLGSFV